MKRYYMLLLMLAMTSSYAETAADLLQEKLNAIKTMEASFKQVVKAKNRVLTRSNGKMALARPGRFRWDTKDPMPQLVIADGKKMWVYDVDLEQVTVRKQEKSMGGTAALFLSGYDDTVARDYEVKQINKGSLVGFDMKARENKSGFQRVKLFFKKEALCALELYDQLGQVTEVDLKKIKINPKLSEQLFQFKPPKGVDVVKQ